MLNITELACLQNIKKTLTSHLTQEKINLLIHLLCVYFFCTLSFQHQTLNTNTTSGFQILHQIYCCIGHHHRTSHLQQHLYPICTHTTNTHTNLHNKLISFIDHISWDYESMMLCCCYNLRFFTLLSREKQKQAFSKKLSNAGGWKLFTE